MQKLENLTQKIMEDAKAEASRISEEADKKQKHIIDERVKEAKVISEKILEKKKLEADTLKERIVSSALRKVRNEELSAKQEVIDKVFGYAYMSLKDLKDEDYLKLLKKMLENEDLSEEKVLKVPLGKKEIAKDLIKEEKIIEEPSLESGFIIVDGNVIYNYSFRDILDEMREELETEIASYLFKE
ncbi:MAG TPA: V-type ATP synthase subunit E [Soehngenia sp.]|nr:V-type ATP synthase subunit E [Soehngenia sp.]HPP30947.1 V-type ATP synthase subunit E [Soehngenia sp.]